MIEQLRQANADLVSQVSSAGALPPAAAPAARRFLDQAELVRRCAEEPVTIGILGVHSTGKSLLLNMLLGNPELLPTGYAPTTGNVTVLHLRSADDVAWAMVSNARVEFLSETDLRGCLDALVADVTRTARESGKVDQAALAELPRLVPEGQARFSPEGWEGVVEWARTSGWPADNSELRLRIMEMLALRDACVVAADVVGREEQVSHETLTSSAVRLDADVIHAAAGPFPAPRGPRMAIRPGSRLSGDDLRAGFAFIRRIHLEIVVPSSVWPLRRLGADAVSLVDFPGLNSVASKSRDGYLTKQEIDRLTSIVVVLDAAKPYDETPLGLATRFGRVRTAAEIAAASLVVANRLDLLPGGLQAAGDQPAPLRAESVLTTHAKALGALLGIADQIVTPGHGDRITLASALHARLTVDPQSAERVDVGSADDVAQAASAWQRLARRLEVDDPGHLLGPLLAEAAEDGGIGRLRAAIADHVAEHGFPLRLSRMRDLISDRVAAQAELARLIRPAASTRRPRETAEQKELRQLLVKIAKDAKALPGRVQKQIAQVQEAPGRTSLRETIESLVVAEVYFWPEWGELLNVVQSGVVPSRRHDGTETRPNDTAELEQSFHEAIDRLEDRIADLDDLTLDGWIEARNAEAAGQRARLRALTEKVTEKATGQTDRLAWAACCVDYAWLRSAVENTSGPASERAPADTGHARHFPLSRRHGLPWHPEYPLPFGRRHDDPKLVGLRHQIHVMAIRRELVNALTRIALARTEDRNRELVGRIRKALEGLRLPLGEREIRRDVQDLLGGGTEAGDSDLQALAEALTQDRTLDQGGR